MPTDPKVQGVVTFLARSTEPFLKCFLYSTERFNAVDRRIVDGGYTPAAIEMANNNVA